MVNTLPPPEVVAHLTGPGLSCVISLQRTDAETGDLTRAKCGTRSYLIARDYHGDSVRQVSGCDVLLMIESVRFPRLLHVSNCRGALKVRRIGDTWTRQLLGASRIAPSRLDRVIYYPVAHRPACYKIAVVFTLPGKQDNGPLRERSATRCDRVSDRSS